jgi:DNA modification methylase
MDGQKADMVFTDPPYGVEYGSSTGVKLVFRANDKTMTQFLKLASYFFCMSH